ncbi:MAG: DUF2505 domain-containing protein, partial [Alcanivorax sp.]|nr:DUF2505 domain-containing protein [Alcanivorax sp.]
MNVTVDREYDTSVERLFEILTSREYFEQRYAWGKVENYRFDTFGQTDDGFLIRIIQPITIRTDRIPGFARRFLPSETDLLTEFLWHPGGGAPYQADYRF